MGLNLASLGASMTMGEGESERQIQMPDGSILERMSGQHQLPGWHLDSATMTFLPEVGAELDVDEYGW